MKPKENQEPQSGGLSRRMLLRLLPYALVEAALLPNDQSIWRTAKKLGDILNKDSMYTQVIAQLRFAERKSLFIDLEGRVKQMSFDAYTVIPFPGIHAP